MFDVKVFELHDFHELQAQVMEDLEFDEMDVIGTTSSTPKLYGHYLSLYHAHVLELKGLKSNVDDLEKGLYLYYTGKATPDIYRKRPLNVVYTKAETPMLIKADELYQKLNGKYEFRKTVCEYLESVLKQIKERTYMVRTIVEWRKFEAGAN